MAFRNCTGLTEIHSNNPVPPDVKGTECFWQVNTQTCKLYVPEGTVAAYRNSNWNIFLNIETANDIINKDNIILRTISNGISIETQEITPIAFFTISGQTVYQSTINGHAEISLDKGIYIVRIKNESQKVVVR
jgi:hypothetical protein